VRRNETTTRIEVHQGTGTRYHSLLYRPDGAVVALDGGGYNRIGGPVDRVPHDVAHHVVEHRLGLDAGLWGVLAAGGIVQNATFAGGRRPPHALRRAAAVTDAAGESLRQAEILVRAVADLTLTRDDPPNAAAFRAAVGERWWTPVATAEALGLACTDLLAAAVRWQALDPGDAFPLAWPMRPLSR